ncbi:PREDICTED: uncharacterized protein LOC104801395 isoform X3 [Tarenaya hassleriana]|uniref:uncharacterized protein LOC104801395 isoform X3 n=1 Tax=Tarenaya hassleriana TaxID=28532 RepID=UPI00053C2F01|nr:PREDICTED: uncharacterized protein LOC104801395 isoform X3 [Tarenaya hassleriana]
MSVDNNQQFTMDPPVETNDGSSKKPRISYKREFLLSLSNLDVCKKLPKLPSGFDESLLRDSEDPLPEHRRISSDLSSHGFRQNDYSSSPPTRGEMGSYSRGTHGKWEDRSGGWNDKVTDSQSEWDSAEPGRRYGMPSRRPWQAPEHDGLLGRGSFPRSSGYGVGTSGQRSQSNDAYQLSRSNEPYHPPRPYKASPYSRRDTKDSFNDETFGSSDSTSEDRAEEERKRRASFELMRKEQHKAFQERQKLSPEGRKKGFDLTELLQDSKDEKGQLGRSNHVCESSILPGSNNTVVPPQNTTPRPLVPPGFANTPLEGKPGVKPPTGVYQHEGSLLNSKDGHLVNGMSGNNEEKAPANQTGSSELLMRSTDVNISTNTSERAVDLSTVLGITTDTIGRDKSFENLPCISNFSEASGYSEKSEQAITKLDQKKSLGNSDGASILDKLFNAALNLNDGKDSNFTEQNDNKVEERSSPQTVKSSKFAGLFLEEDNKPYEDISSSEQSNGLLSLLQGANKLQIFDVKSKDELSARLPFQGHDTKNPDQLIYTSPSKSAAVPPVLTCEDLEQSILSEVSDSYSHPPPAMRDSDVSSVRNKQQKAYVDDHASHHLLSLLQRGAGPENQFMRLFSNAESRPSAEQPPETSGIGREAADSGNTLTLETLFGSAFMKELQSVGESASANAGVSEAHSLSLSAKDEGLLLAGTPFRLDQSISEASQSDQMRSDGLPGGLFRSADNATELGPRIGAAGVGLLGEDNLLAVNGTANMQKFVPFQGSPNQEPKEGPFNLAEKLAALNYGPRKERLPIGSQDSPFLRHPPHYPNGPDLPFQPSSAHPQLQPSHLNGSGPLFHSFDPHHGTVKSQSDLMATGSFHQDHPPNHQFPANMIHPPFHHSPGGVPELDRHSHPMLQEMHMRSNMPHPHHVLQGFPGGPLHHQPPGVNNQMPGVVPGLSASQGFPFAHWQPNFARHNMPPPVTQVKGSDNSGSLQRFLGMDPKQIQPMMGQAGGPHRQGSLGYGLDLGFGHR